MRKNKNVKERDHKPQRPCLVSKFPFVCSLWKILGDFIPSHKTLFWVPILFFKFLNFNTKQDLLPKIIIIGKENKRIWPLSISCVIVAPQLRLWILKSTEFVISYKQNPSQQVVCASFPSFWLHGGCHHSYCL